MRHKTGGDGERYSARRRQLESQRIDKWLWVARFFKTRSSAATAVSGGRVHVNGQRVKPARALHTGDRLRIQRGEQTYEVTLLGFARQRRPSAEAVLLYEESGASRAAREAARAARRNEPAGARAGRPDRQQRRQLARLRRALSD